MSTKNRRQRSKDDQCCGRLFLKYVLFIFNLIFWVSGLALLAVGIWTLIAKHAYVSLLTGGTYAATTYILLGTGGIIIFVGTLGCVGALREHRGLLMVYAFFLLLIFLLEAISGILAYMYEATVREELYRSLNQTMLQNYKYDTEKTIAIDDMQNTFNCCGAGEFTDWKHSRWIKAGQTNNTAPDSCCITPSPNCGVLPGPSNIYYDGCLTKFENYLRRHLIIVGAVGLGICCLQIFGIIFACLARRVKEYEDRRASDVW